MWLPDKDDLLKIRIQDNGEDVETPWAEDLGPSPDNPEARLVQLGNVPFLHAKPTYEDVLEVTLVDGMYQWDAEGVPFERIHTRIAVDHGRWAMIVDYALRDTSTNLVRAFQDLDRAAEKLEIALEGAYVNPDERGGRAYLAIPPSLDSPEGVIDLLSEAPIAVDLGVPHGEILHSSIAMVNQCGPTPRSASDGREGPWRQQQLVKEPRRSQGTDSVL